LRAIGELDAKQEDALRQMEPKLAQVYGQQGAWFDLIARQMDFPDDLPDRIRAIWEAGKTKAERQGLTVDAGEFTQQFVDANFAH
jgi:hypothetical protein